MDNHFSSSSSFPPFD